MRWAFVYAVRPAGVSPASADAALTPVASRTITA